MSREMRLFKLLTDEADYGFPYVSEMGWISDVEFCVWVNYTCVEDFMYVLTDIFGYGIFDDSGFNANMQHNCICIDLCKAIGDCLDIESIFSKTEYQH